MIHVRKIPKLLIILLFFLQQDTVTAGHPGVPSIEEIKLVIDKIKNHLVLIIRIDPFSLYRPVMCVGRHSVTSGHPTHLIMYSMLFVIG